MTKAIIEYGRYLADKKAIDDVSLNRAVQAEAINWINDRQQASKPLRIVEAGAGIGTMLERVMEATRPLHWTYTAVELEPGFQEQARHRLQDWCSAHDFDFKVEQDARWRLENNHSLVEVNWLGGDILEVTKNLPPGSVDLMIAHAVIDLLPAPLCLPDLLACLAEQGAYYFSLNYAGQTTFQPPHPHDEAIVAAYHADMDSRFTDINWRASQTGVLLAQWLADNGHPVIAAGLSDWDLQSTQNRTDSANRFINDILDTMEKALAGHADLPEWLAMRRRQLSAGELCFHAANRDYFGLTGKPYMGTRSL